MVDDGGDAAVGVDGDEPGLLLDVLADVDGLPGVLQTVGLLELLEDDGRLVAVGCACAVLDVVLRAKAGWVGVYLPKVRSSMPLVAMRPVGRAMISSALDLARWADD